MNEFVMPHLNKFGAKCINEIASIAIENKLNKALIITDNNLQEIGISNKITKILCDANLQYATYAKVQQNPTKENVYEAFELYRDENCDFIIGLGGGSSNDCAKAVGILASNGGKLEDYVGLNKSKNAAPLMMLVNTTAGTASEISRAYLISDEKKHEKLIFKDIHALSYCAFNDPELMLQLPAKITAGTGMDALTHAIESYVCTGKYSLTQKLAIVAMELVFDNLRKVIGKPFSIELRNNMIYAQSLAGMAFCNSGVGLVHAMAHQLGAVCNLPHGLCNAILLPHVMQYNRRVCEDEYAQLARRLFTEKCRDKSTKKCTDIMIHEVLSLSNDVGTAVRLRDIGVKESDYKLLAEKSLVDGNIFKNPIMPSLEDVIELFKNAS
jgi:alcohol dehydrogenase